MKPIDDEIASLEEKLEKLIRRSWKTRPIPENCPELTVEKEETERTLEEKMDRWVYLNDLAEKDCSAERKWHKKVRRSRRKLPRLIFINLFLLSYFFFIKTVVDPVFNEILNTCKKRNSKKHAQRAKVSPADW